MPKAANPMWSTHDERICLEERLHPIVLAPSFARALALAGLGAALSQLGWFLTPVGAVLVGLGAAIAVNAAWRWERTRLVVTTEKLYVVHGTFRRRAAGIRLARAGAIEIEQTLVGRLVGYGTLIAANLEIDFVADPQEVWHLVGGTKIEEIELAEREPSRRQLRPVRASQSARRRTA
jgi:PH (Pleckstrin Homology) domain-containing protein